ncbi:MAG: polymer-forming cytoskeletal protein [Bryocella sp.]
MTTVLGRMTRLRGDLECQGDVQLEGEFDGATLQSGGRLTIGAEAVVRAQITAQDVVVMGRVEGTIRAAGRVELRSTAVVNGDVIAERISMEENAKLRGKVDPSAGREAEVVSQAASASHVTEAQLWEPEQEIEHHPVEAAPPVVETPLRMQVRESEHRQAAPLREDSSAGYRAQPLPSAAAPVRQLPSALAAFAPGGRKALSERGTRVMSTAPKAAWRRPETE